MRRWRSEQPRLRWAGAALVPLVIGGSSETAAITAAAGISLLVIAVAALGAAFGRSAARRRACLQALEVLLRLAPWTAKR